MDWLFFYKRVMRQPYALPTCVKLVMIVMALVRPNAVGVVTEVHDALFYSVIFAICFEAVSIL